VGTSSPHVVDVRLCFELANRLPEGHPADPQFVREGVDGQLLPGLKHAEHDPVPDPLRRLDTTPHTARKICAGGTEAAAVDGCSANCGDSGM